MANIRCMIFDFGRVIGNFDHDEACNKLRSFCFLSTMQIHSLIFRTGLEKKYDKGEISSEEFYLKVKKAIKADESLTYEKFRGIWGNIFSKNQGMEEFLEKISEGRRLMLLSNTNYLHWRFISRMQIIKRFFPTSDNLILSFREHSRKPETKIFLKAIRKSGYKPHEIVYIDDIEENVNVFRSLGGNGIVYNCRRDSLMDLAIALFEL